MNGFSLVLGAFVGMCVGLERIEKIRNAKDTDNAGNFRTANNTWEANGNQSTDQSRNNDVEFDYKAVVEKRYQE